MTKKKSKEFLHLVVAEMPDTGGLVLGPVGAFVVKISGRVDDFLCEQVRELDELKSPLKIHSLWVLQKDESPGPYYFGEESRFLMLDKNKNKDEQCEKER